MSSIALRFVSLENGCLWIFILLLFGIGLDQVQADGTLYWETRYNSQALADSKALLAVGNSLWILRGGNIYVTDMAGKKAELLPLPTIIKRVDSLEQESDRVLLFSGEEAWVSQDSGKVWSPCSAACLDPFFSLNPSYYPDSAANLGGSSFLASPSGLLVSINGALLGNGKTGRNSK
jgi:hypothetical protein